MSNGENPDSPPAEMRPDPPPAPPKAPGKQACPLCRHEARKALNDLQLGEDGVIVDEDGEKWIAEKTVAKTLCISAKHLRRERGACPYCGEELSPDDCVANLWPEIYQASVSIFSALAQSGKAVMHDVDGGGWFFRRDIFDLLKSSHVFALRLADAAFEWAYDIGDDNESDAGEQTSD